MTTELTLRAFGELAARGELPVHVALRGDPDVLRSRAWPGASTETDSTDPHAFLGQSGWRGPDRRVELAFHQLRPLTGGPRLQWLHDTIPIHFARNAVDRRLRVAYLRRIVRTSSELLVDSRHTARCVVDELGADPERLTIITFPVDTELARIVQARRSVLAPAERLLFIGRFAQHKNVERLIRAFARTDFGARGGELHLVGGSDEEVQRFRTLCRQLPHRITIEGSVPRARIVDLLASSAGLIQPSLEEGFGLPVWEARTVGLPVVAANAGSLPELMTDPDNLFDPFDLDAIATAIDMLMNRTERSPNEPPPEGPDLVEFGRTVLRTLQRAMSNSGSGGSTASKSHR